MDATLGAWLIDRLVQSGLPMGLLLFAAWWLRGYIAENTGLLRELRRDVDAAQDTAEQAHKRIDRHLETAGVHQGD